MDDNTTILVIVIGLVASGFYYGYIPLQPTAMPSHTNVNVNVTNPAGGSSNETTTRADLRQIAAPYLAATDIAQLCLTAGGTWHETADFVGCDGVGSPDCSGAITVTAGQQCAAVGANWVCDMTHVYCKYP